MYTRIHTIYTYDEIGAQQQRQESWVFSSGFEKDLSSQTAVCALCRQEGKRKAFRVDHRNAMSYVT